MPAELQVYRLSISGRSPVNYNEMVFHFRVNNTVPTNDFLTAKQLVEAVLNEVGASSWRVRLLNCMSDEATITRVHAGRVAPTGGNYADAIPSTGSLVGNVSAVVAPSQAAGCLIWLSNTEQEKTGRTFVYGVPEEWFEEGKPTSTARTEYETFITRHIAGFSLAAGVALPTIYRQSDKSDRLITQGYVSPKLGTQRRRELPL